MSRRWCLATLCLIIAITAGCTGTAVSKNEKLSDIKTEPHIQPGDELPSVLFDLKPSNPSPNAVGFQFYDCTYKSRGKTAKFRLKFKQGRRFADDFAVGMVEGEFLPVAGSDNSALLPDLKTALDAKIIPRNSPRVTGLPFDAVILGEKQSRSASGGFSANPAGDWMTIKIFLPKGGDEAQVFLNLNPSLGKGEFSLKDSDYGDYLLRELAKVL
jgi:hypothetical protein